MNPGAGRGATPRPGVFPVVVGSIAYAPIKPAKGVTKPRRSVVLMKKPGESGRFIVIGITSDGGNYDPSNTCRYPRDTYFPMPNEADGPATTGLPLRCAAYAEFLQDFALHELAGTAGYVDAATLDALITWIQAYILNHGGPRGG